MENNPKENTAGETTPNPSQTAPRTYADIKTISFHGTGIDLFSTFIINALLTLLTLGFYYPWAKAKILTFNYGNTEFLGSRFTFHGTGKEMFRGFVFGLLLIGGWYGLSWLLQSYLSITTYLFSTILISVVSIAVLTPLLIHGTLRYRTSRSSWRGLYFQYKGNRKALYKIVGKLLLVAFGSFTVLSAFFYFILPIEISNPFAEIFEVPLYFYYGMMGAGLISIIYSIWIKVEVYHYIFSNLSLGNMTFKFTGKASGYLEQYFIYFVQSVVLTFFLIIIMAIFSGITTSTIGIVVGVFIFYAAILLFYFNLKSKLFNYTANNIRMHQDHIRRKGTLKTKTTALDWLGLYFVNALIILFSLGLATPWALVRTMKFYAKHLTVLGSIDFDTIEQASVDYSGTASAEGLYDAFDYDFQII